LSAFVVIYCQGAGTLRVQERQFEVIKCQLGDGMVFRFVAAQ